MLLTKRPLFALIFLLALLLRVAVPAGFMPDIEQGKVAITICHGADIKTIWVDADQAPSKEADQKQDCPFTPIASTASSVEAPLASALIVPYVSSVSYRFAQDIVQNEAFWSHAQPRAPPVIL